MKGKQVQSLVCEDSTCLKATTHAPQLWNLHVLGPGSHTTEPTRCKHVQEACAPKKKKRRSLCTAAKVLHATNAYRNKTQNGHLKKKKKTLGTDGFVEKSYPTCKDFCFIVNYTSLAPKTMSHMGLCLVLFAEWIFFFFLVLPVYCYQPISLHPRAHMLSHVIPWNSARQTPLSMDSRQEYWSGLPFPSPEWISYINYFI